MAAPLLSENADLSDKNYFSLFHLLYHEWRNNPLLKLRRGREL
ncbi:hypothetical protein KNP414_03621 [Paenibacillus mucilaginosus KNP414]|uniref:Uncharacterized protein n=1 Tax=Paenibacillus mucilaginosus (strain KNP414) TaxID=1036673 RepID=F8FDJ5_PAEMK|nr:hypothetical protein KNP414_03621 [Paenibacillus mucilaginosus KNP414]